MTTKTSVVRVSLAAGVAAAVMAFAGAASACDGAGVITRIDGDPAKVSIKRAGGGQVSRPRVLEVICAGDVIKANGATVTLSLDGRGNVQVTSTYQVATRGGAPSLAGNAYRAVNDQVMPDMKRLPWDVRLKGPEDPLTFALFGLTRGTQELPAGNHSLLVRVLGGSGPYSATVSGPSGPVSGSAQGGEIRLPSAAYGPGRYTVSVKDATGAEVSADFAVINPAPPVPAMYASLEDPEVRAAATAASIARNAPTTRAFEAEQLLAASPANGLDRGRVYDLIESYGE